MRNAVEDGTRVLDKLSPLQRRPAARPSAKSGDAAKLSGALPATPSSQAVVCIKGEGRWSWKSEQEVR